MFPTFYIPGGGVFQYGELECRNYQIDYQPNVDTPRAGAGNLAVAIIRTTPSGDEFDITLPTGWKWFWNSVSKSTYYKTDGPVSIGVAYKVLEAADLNTAHVFTHEDGNIAGAELCGTVFVFSDYNADIPLDYLQYSQWQVVGGAATAGTVMGGQRQHSAPVQDAYIFSLTTTRGMMYDDVNSEIGFYQVPHVPEGLIYSDYRGVNNYGFWVNLYRSSAGLTNLLTDERWDATCSGWTGFSTDSVESSYVLSSIYTLCRVVATAATSKHYISKQVSLTAGEKYTWCVSTRGSGYTPYGNAALGIVPPSGAANEFGFAYKGSQWLNLDPDNCYTDPQGGYRDWWTFIAIPTEADGLPAYPPHQSSIQFTAQETGTYELRIYVLDSSLLTQPTWADLEHSGGDTLYIFQTALFNGTVVWSWVPGDTTAPFLIQETPWMESIGDEWGSEASSTITFVVNKAGPVPPAHFIPFEMRQADELATDGLSKTSLMNVLSGNDHAGRPEICTRVVYPTYNGTLRKYYAEFTIGTNVGTSVAHHNIIVAMSSAPLQDCNDSPASNSFYEWARTGSFNGPGTDPASSAWAISAGDKLGVMVNYVDGEVTFYKNGSATGTYTMEAVAGREHVDLPFLLLIASGISGTSTSRFDWTANLTGPFTYLPAGANAWDIANEVT